MDISWKVYCALCMLVIDETVLTEHIYAHTHTLMRVKSERKRMGMRESIRYFVCTSIFKHKMASKSNIYMHSVQYGVV